MENANMKANRFYNWAQAKKRYAAIISTLNAGGSVVVSTCTRATEYKAKHAAMFKALPGGLYVQSGKKWLCLNFTNIKFYN